MLIGLFQVLLCVVAVAAGILPTDSSLTEIIPYLGETAISTSVTYGKDQDGSDKSKRQAVMTRALRAIYNYHCPHAIETSRTFVWQAIYTPATADLELQSFRNINAWSQIAKVDSNFSAYWYNKFCTVRQGQWCMYRFKGYTQGEVTRNGIILELVTVSDIPEILPKIEEACLVPTGTIRANQCPAVEGVYTVCHITGINVVVVN